jgi:hypothetical protein
MAADSSSDDEGRGRFDEAVDFFSIEEGGRQTMAERKTGTNSSDSGDRWQCQWAMLGFGPLSIWVIVEWIWSPDRNIMGKEQGHNCQNSSLTQLDSGKEWAGAIQVIRLLL